MVEKVEFRGHDMQLRIHNSLLRIDRGRCDFDINKIVVTLYDRNSKHMSIFENLNSQLCFLSYRSGTFSLEEGFGENISGSGCWFDREEWKDLT